ncbi:putative ATP-dependent endonuclease of OLD family [Parabacteroides sp. PFB2-12]|uniref:ATP-binding protein n=1 Tax=unclassified Parabacteroides TaxID=2649774 RepID=UPI0024771290|nr:MULTISPECIES: ATP-binding protein [unclassified Parabacteroides]MDH6343745.1 putative ATP-dependent endonuclease of OLD family [Parabacteroides sp. PM6-13]MDH6391907.1 putative ATP-dependent endonuclease of OLD family [Parabacteroides sp. PFB2-12]
MKLKTIHIRNFRCFKDEVSIEFDNITTIIGKNDIGKSTILEALEIFFNNDTVKIEPNDASISSSLKQVTITCDFIDIPPVVTLDSGSETSLSNEYLLYSDNLLRVKKVFDCGKSKPSSEVYIVANHPTAKGYDNLLELKEKDLQKIIKDNALDVTLKGNPKMRAAIWNACSDLNFSIVEIPVNKTKEDAKAIWDKIDSYLPIFALFQSDRSSHDSDGEVQNPMKAAIAEAISEAQKEIEDIQEKVRAKALDIANQTHKALEEIDSSLAGKITPSFTSPTASKWGGLFSISMETDEGIALNKRGSGVRRMILVSFFKAEAERKITSSNKKSIIYAIEEPETAQHPNNQRILIKSFLDLSQNPQCQVILTTHSPELAKELPVDSIRFVDRDNDDNPAIKKGDDVLLEVANTLGVFADKRIQALVCVEGPTDVIALNNFCRCLREKDPSIIDIENDERIALIPLGGSILKQWVELHYLRKLNCPEIHIYDNDVATYQHTIDAVNSRGDGSWGTLTKKREIENYLHTDAIKEIYAVDIDTNLDEVPKLFGKAYSTSRGLDGNLKDNTSKKYLCKVFNEAMNYDRLMERDTTGEINSWFEKIKSILH